MLYVLEWRCVIGDGAGVAVVHGAAVAASAGRMVRCCEVRKISRVPSARRRDDEGVRVRVGPADGRRRLLGGLRAPSGHIRVGGWDKNCERLCALPTSIESRVPLRESKFSARDSGPPKCRSESRD